MENSILKKLEACLYLFLSIETVSLISSRCEMTIGLAIPNLAVWNN